MSTARINLFWLIVFACTMPIGVVISTHLARNSFERVSLRDQTIRVKGYAEQAIVSDRAEWSAGVSVRNADRTVAYRSLEADRKRLLAFLAEHGFADEAVELFPVSIRTIYKLDEDGDNTNTIEAYALSQSLQIESTDVEKIATVARAASDLIGEGVELNARTPRYLYTKLETLKLEMIAAATDNALQRATAMVEHSGGTLGEVRSASQGVFQITPAFSTSVSNSGYLDTTSIQKAIKAVVTIEYALQ